MGLGSRRITWRAALSIAGAAGVLGGVVPAAAPATAGSGGFAVTRVQLSTGQAESVAADPATGLVYAGFTQLGGQPPAIDVIDGTSNTVTATISLTGVPLALAVDPSTDTLYAVSNGAVTVISGATNTVTTTISLPAGATSRSVAVNPATHMVYVANVQQGTVIVIDGTTNTVTATIPVADPADTTTPEVFGVAVDTATGEVYATDTTHARVAVIDAASDTVTSRIALPSGSLPTGLAVDPDAGRIYVADAGTNAISVIDAGTAAVTATITGGMTQPFGVAFDPGNGDPGSGDPGSGVLYASSRLANVPGAATAPGATYVIDTASQAVTTQIPRGGVSIAVLPASGAAYADSGINGQLSGSLAVITPSSATTMSPEILSATRFTFTTGAAGQDQLLASATPAAAFSATGLPAGLTLSPAGLLSGTPAAGAGGFYDVPVTAANGIAPDQDGFIDVTVDQPESITSRDQATFRTGIAGSFTVTASGFPAGSITETGALPAGVTLSTAGVLSGTPAWSANGIYHIELTARNNVESPATQAFTLTVRPPPARPRAPRRAR